MKKFLLLTFAVVFSLGAFADIIVKVTKSGSNDGVHYERIKEFSSDTHYTLSCLNPGPQTCPPVGIVTAGGAIIFIENEIANGETGGVFFHNGQYWVKWIGQENPSTGQYEYQMIAAETEAELENEPFTISF
ncbi:MAG: hypothetical protein J4F31_00355 [Flavobacteriales bacterium]|nr:hypothetical protein [Flavobacteriales bacterium]